MKLACHLMHNMQTSCLSITETLLGRFCPLVSKDVDEVSSTLSEIKTWVELLHKMEQDALKDVFAVGFVQDLVWPLLTFAREIIVMLLETKFSSVTEEIFDLVAAHG